jgi:uncharacterized heparinase superfamily protein
MTSVGQWIRYLLHIPPKRIFAKIVHDYRVNAFIKANRFSSMAVGAQAEIPFALPALLAFAKHYRVQGVRFTNATQIERGIFEVKGATHDFGSVENIRWADPFQTDRSRAQWLHDLSFFSFALPLADDRETDFSTLLARLVTTLEVTSPVAVTDKSGQLPFVWSPIALALRIMGLSSAASLMLAANPLTSEPSLRILRGHVHRCAALLEVSAERYLGYNHQVFAEVALFVADLALDRFSNGHLIRAVKALNAYLLTDGMWSERSASYHIHMLLLAQSLLATREGDAALQDELAQIVVQMETALACLVHPDGEIAIFNDAAMEDSVPPAAVGWLHTENSQKIRFLPVAGFARLSNGDTTLIMDAGAMGPDDVIGHGHADFLSIEVSIGATRLFVDPGTASIANDDARRWTRSAASHNGPGVIGLEPAEFFGAWRVGRRGRAWFDTPPTSNADGSLKVSGTCNGYRRQFGLVNRTVILAKDGSFTLIDRWPLAAAGRGRSRFILPESWAVQRLSSGSICCKTEHGLSVIITLMAGSIGEIGLTNWFPAGPMQPRSGTAIELRDVDSLVQVIVRRVSD